MPLEISPSSEIDAMAVGEECVFALDTTKELKTKILSSWSYKIFNSSMDEVTTDFSGGSTEDAGIITFGIIAKTIGTYTLQFIVTCIDKLPNNTTPYEFYVVMTLHVV